MERSEISIKIFILSNFSNIAIGLFHLRKYIFFTKKFLNWVYFIKIKDVKGKKDQEAYINKTTQYSSLDFKESIQDNLVFYINLWFKMFLREWLHRLFPSSWPSLPWNPNQLTYAHATMSPSEDGRWQVPGRVWRRENPSYWWKDFK